MGCRPWRRARVRRSRSMDVSKRHYCEWHWHWKEPFKIEASAGSSAKVWVRFLTILGSRLHSRRAHSTSSLFTSILKVSVPLHPKQNPPVAASWRTWSVATSVRGLGRCKSYSPKDCYIVAVSKEQATMVRGSVCILHEKLWNVCIPHCSI